MWRFAMFAYVFLGSYRLLGRDVCVTRELQMSTTYLYRSVAFRDRAVAFWPSVGVRDRKLKK